MSCPLCGDTCRCSASGSSSAPLRGIADPEISLGVASSGESHEPPPTEVAVRDLQKESIEAAIETSEEDSTWRQELSARLNRYHSRRKPRPPRYPSLQLKFEQSSTISGSQVRSDFSTLPSSSNQIFSNQTVSNQALAFDQVLSVDHPLTDPRLPVPRKPLLLWKKPLMYCLRPRPTPQAQRLSSSRVPGLQHRPPSINWPVP